MRSERLRIGFLATQFEESYQHAVFQGAVEEGARSSFQLVFFEGSNAETQRRAGALDETAFSLAALARLDGLIIMTNTMGSSYDTQRIAGYLARFSGIPMVSLGVEFPGVAFLKANTKGGIRSEVAHLIKVHDRHSFVFLAGPRNHPESEQREAEFKEMIEELAPGAKAEIRYGDFLEERAYHEVMALIASGWGFDAVVAANDQMAMGAIRALSEHGIPVPEAVSVTGFDDIPDSLQSLPPLTTIHQPMAELGRQAVRYLAMRFRSGRPEDEVSDLSSAFVVRESCGCVGAMDALSIQALEQRLREEVSKRVAAEERTALLRRIESAMVRSFSLEDILRELAEGVRDLAISCCAVVLFDTKSSSPEWSDLLMLSHDGDIRILTPYGVRFPPLTAASQRAFPTDPCLRVRTASVRTGADRLPALLRRFRRPPCVRHPPGHPVHQFERGVGDDAGEASGDCVGGTSQTQDGGTVLGQPPFEGRDIPEKSAGTGTSGQLQRHHDAYRTGHPRRPVPGYRRHRHAGRSVGEQSAGGAQRREKDGGGTFPRRSFDGIQGETDIPQPVSGRSGGERHRRCGASVDRPGGGERSHPADRPGRILRAEPGEGVPAVPDHPGIVEQRRAAFQGQSDPRRDVFGSWDGHGGGFGQRKRV